MTTQTSRRAVLAGSVATLAATAPVAAVSGPDPVYAAIDRYRAAFKYFGECLDKAAVIEKELSRRAEEAAEPRMGSRYEFEAAHPEHKFETSQEVLRSHFKYEEVEKLKDTDEAEEAKRLEHEGSNLNDEAAWALAHTAPTTVAGAVALLAFLRERDDMGDEIGLFQNDTGPVLAFTVMASVESFLRSQLSNAA